jgi:epothilone synthetase B
MSLSALLDRLNACGAELWAERDELVVRAPREALGPELRARLTAHKQEILQVLRGRNEKPGSLRLPQIVPAPESRHEPFPLTDIQQVYWLGRNPSFELGKVGIHLYEELDCLDLNLERLNQAWQRVIKRHDMLRAVVLPDGQQRILEQATYDIELLDLRGRSTDEQTAELREVRAQLSHHVYSPETWPLFRILVCRLDEQRVRLCISIDALHIDMGSFAIVFKDWINFYATPETHCPPLELSYRDYALALNAIRETPVYQRSLRYWQERAAELPPPPDLPRAQSPDTLTEQKFERRRGGLDKDNWLRLKNRAAQRGLTPSGLTLAAYAEVLATWSASLQFSVNVTLFNRLRVHPQINEIAGDFTSMILLGVDHTADDAFGDRARHIQKQLWNGIKNRYVSGVHVLREVARLRGQGASQLIMPVVYTSTLNLSTQGLMPLKTLGERVYSIMQTPQVSVDLQLYEEEGALVFNWDAVKGLFPEGVVEEMFNAYGRLLTRLANEEECWLESEPQLIPAAQLRRREIVNATEASVPHETIDDLFLAQASRRPHQTALVATDRVLDYQELRRRSGRVARYLREWGVRPNSLVAVVMEKGWEQVVAALGVLQSGAAYMPIAPEAPAERLRYLLNHGGVKLALTQSRLDDRLAWPEGVRRFCLDEEDFESALDSPLETTRRPEDLAYVIYTSGSTGFPKGVMIEHGSVVNRILDVNRRFRVVSEDRVLALTAMHHDLSVYDLFGSLAAGATIIMPDAAGAKDPAHWARLMLKERVTIWNTVPAFMEMLVEYLEHTGDRSAILPRSLRLVLLAGDWIPVHLPNRIKALMPGVEVISLGGPTETTVWDICYPVQTVAPEWQRIPYGQPMLNSKYFVLNETLRPCPDWVAGELYIGGAGLARGYWRDEERTCAAFIRHPQTGERLYRSGDLGRFLPDGNIDILGRKDFQIKLRGYRIEAGEIEETIKRHPAVRAVVVTASGGEGRDKQLIAYVVPKRKQRAFAETASTAQPCAAERQYSPQRTTLDAARQVEFRLSQPGLRYDLNGRPHVRLVKPGREEDLTETYTRRRSHRTFARAPLGSEQLAELLGCLRCLHLESMVLPKYRYPSAGALYPVQTYVYVAPGRVEGIASGIYYHHPANHELVLISEHEVPRDIHVPHNVNIVDESAFTIFLVGCLEAVRPLYGELAESFCLLEAGHIGQLLMTEAPVCGIGLCPVGDLDASRLKRLLALDESHLCLYGLFGGPVGAASLGDPASLETATALPPSAPCSVDSNGHDSLVGELRRLLEAALPEYMVPSTFVMLDALPLTASGKVDCKALPGLPASNVMAEHTYKPPETELERLLADTVREILELDRVGINDRFFNLGGNSMHLLHLSLKLSEVLRREVPIVQLFRHPTINSLAEYLTAGQDEQTALRQGAGRAAIRQKSTGRRRPAG